MEVIKLQLSHRKVSIWILLLLLNLLPILRPIILFAQSNDVAYDRIITKSVLSDTDFQKAKNIIRRAELYRGNAHEDFFYRMKVIDTQNKEVKSTTDIKVNVKQNYKKGTRSSLISIESGNSRGNLILQKDVNMWFYKPGTSNPLRISPAQRFIGGASYADVSSTNYTLYYEPVNIEEQDIGKTTAYKIELLKIKNGVSFDKIIFYIAVKGDRPIKSEFYTKSGRLVKSMYFREFKKLVSFGVISTEWIIVDNINPNNVTNISIDDIGKETLNRTKFTPDGLRK